MGAEDVGPGMDSKRPGASQRITWEGTVCQGHEHSCGGHICLQPSYSSQLAQAERTFFHFAAAEAEGQLSASFLGSCAGVRQI